MPLESPIQETTAASASFDDVSNLDWFGGVSLNVFFCSLDDARRGMIIHEQLIGVAVWKREQCAEQKIVHGDSKQAIL